MPTPKDNELSIEYTPSGRNGTATLTARCNGETIAVDSFNLAKGKARADFAAEVCKRRPGIDRNGLDSELLRIADEVASKNNGDGRTDAAELPEIDTSRIVRPERFISPEVSSLAIPTMTELDGRPVGRMLLYLRWADGRRERRAMPMSIDLPARSRLWIHPQPSAPTASMSPGWSRDARKEWLHGSDAPEPAELFKRLCERIAHFIDLPPQHAAGTTATLALWTILTYCFSVWDAVPYLFVGGPLGSGKSRVFEILSRLVFRPLSSSNLTAAALFRTLHNQGGTLLFDEAERLKQTSDPATGEINSMLLAGYKRGGQATRLEPIGDTFRTVSFDVYGPKALACIAGLPPALSSRCIPLMMFRAPPGSDKPRRRIDADPVGWQLIRDGLHEMALENGATWLDLPTRTGVCPAMSGRDFELWQPLLALASWIEAAGASGLLGLLQSHALATIDENQDDQTPDADETLLRILADEIRFGKPPTPGDVLAKAKNGESDSFKNWSAKAVSAHLKRYGLTTNKSHGRKVYGKVTVDDLRRIQTTYAVDLGLDANDER
ncbi:MAG: hypothetical protein O3C40_31680 [Planctomycetota bacterium]|nr:hypothetical protein [Planctomycetota bacterium]